MTEGTQTANPLSIRPATAADAGAMAAIYSHYAIHTTSNFDEAEISADEMAGRIAEVHAAGLPWLVAVRDGEISGFAYAGRWKGRCAYRFAVEVTAYVRRGAEGGGIGSTLYGALLPMLRERKIHTLLAGIALPNDASVALHEKFGFRKSAHFAEVGFKFGRCVDVGYWQLKLPSDEAQPPEIAPIT